MKLYEKNRIWVPVEDGDVVPANSRTIDGRFYRPYSYVIVLTIEELREVYSAAVKHTLENVVSERTNGELKVKSPSFDEFMSSKGITI